MKEFKEILNKYNRVAIAGGSKTGKTTLSSQCADRPIYHTDDDVTTPWADIPGVVLGKVSKLGTKYLVEGCQVPRCLRKGLEVDAVVWLSEPHQMLTPKQQSFNKGIQTTFNEWSSLAKVPIFYL